MKDRLSPRRLSIIVDHFSSCGIDTRGSTVALLGKGLLHNAYQIIYPDGAISVLKIPKKARIHGLQQDTRNITLAKRYLGSFLVENTTLYTGPGQKYVISSDYAIGCPLSTNNLADNEEHAAPLKEQLHDIFEANAKMQHETSYILDLLGFQGFKAALLSRSRRAPPLLTNIFVTYEAGNPQLKIIDTDLISTERQRGRLHHAITIFAYKAQKRVLERHFSPSLQGIK